MYYVKLLILAIIETITEFIPVSSTGHMVIFSYIMNLPKNNFIKLYIISIQLGPTISMVLFYKNKLFSNLYFSYKEILIAIIPAIILGTIFNDIIDHLLDNTFSVAISTIIGGIILIIINKLINKKYKNKKKITYLKAFNIGIFQCLAMIPGISRSAASIIGGVIQKIDYKNTINFSFILAIPTILSAIIKKIFDIYIGKYIFYIQNKNFNINKLIYYIKNEINIQDLEIIIFGNITTFVLSILTIKYSIYYLKKYGLIIFGYYRIIIGIIVLIIYYS